MPQGGSYVPSSPAASFLPVVVHPELPVEVAGVYAPAGALEPDSPAFIVVAGGLDEAARERAARVCQAHHRLGHRPTDDPELWRRQEDAARGLVERELAAAS
jgi:hypothetical protein